MGTLQNINKNNKKFENKFYNGLYKITYVCLTKIEITKLFNLPFGDLANSFRTGRPKRMGMPVSNFKKDLYNIIDL